MPSAASSTHTICRPVSFSWNSSGENAMSSTGAI